MRVLTIGDGHVVPDQDLSRWTLAGQLLVDERPDVLIFGNDFLVLECLSGWDKYKKKKMEGKRYKKEVQAGNTALDMLFMQLKLLQQKQKEAKKKVYRPSIYYIEGNHDQRLKLYLEREPTFDGMLGIQRDLRLDERGIRFIPYKEYVYLNKVGFTHVPFNRANAITGVDICRKASAVNINSCVFWHTHDFNVSNVQREGQSNLQQVLNGGCFFEDTSDYLKGIQTNYWRGVIMLDIYGEGKFDFHTYSIERLRKMYGTNT